MKLSKFGDLPFFARQVRAWRAASLLALVLAATPAVALVGPVTDGAPFAAHAVMVLAIGGGGSEFCSGVVLADTIVLTAAHCVAGTERTRIHFRDVDGSPVLLPVAEIVRHPGFHADAVRARRRSIDLALVRLAAPLPARFSAAVLGGMDHVALGQKFRIAGFGVSREGDGKTGGVLRTAVLAARAPLSTVLLWAHDPEDRGAGACMGDSGAPIFLGEDGAQLVAVATWAAGKGKSACGALTQGILIGPQRSWIDGVLKSWRARQ